MTLNNTITKRKYDFNIVASTGLAGCHSYEDDDVDVDIDEQIQLNAT